MVDVALCASLKRSPDTDQEPGDQPKLVSSLSVPFGSPGLQQIPKEKETQDQTIRTEPVFADGDAMGYLACHSTCRKLIPN